MSIEILPLRPSSLLLKLERGVCDLMAHWALLRRYDRGVSTVQLCTLIWCIWHVDPVAGCPTYQRKEVERQE